MPSFNNSVVHMYKTARRDKILANYSFILIIVQPTAYLLRSVNSKWTVPEGSGLIVTNNNKEVLGIEEEKDGGLVVSENDKEDGSQEWTVTTVEKDTQTFHVFSIKDFVLTGKWNINVQGNVQGVS